MPIYDQSYRPYEGVFESHSRRWMIIAKAGLKHYLSRRVFLVFLFIASIPAIVRGVLIWLSHRTGSGLAIINADFFRNFLWWQGPFLMLVCIWPGATLISRDLKTNAIQLYLSKPLTRVDYVLGKFAIIAGISAIILPAPALALFLMEIGLSENLDFLAGHFWLPLSIVGYSAAVITAAGLLSLAISSVTHSGRYAGLLFFAIVFFSQIAGQILSLITGSNVFMVLAPFELMNKIGGLFFLSPTQMGLQPIESLLVYAGTIALTIWILRRRVRAVEIVT